MRILIVDDEPPARARLRTLVEEIDAGEVVGEAGNGADALRIADQTQADILLLDIRMPGMDGVEVARHLDRLEQPPAVIFTTAYDSHALAAIEANAVAYLLKPIRRERLAVAIERASALTRAQVSGLESARSEPARARTHVSATAHGTLQLLPVSEVRIFRAEHKYVTVRHPGGELIIDDALGALETEFGDRFLRVHRNALVAVGHLRAIRRGAEGHHVVQVEGLDDEVEISRRMLPSVRRALKTVGTN